MRKRILALILSFFYSGLGQIYKRETLKGFDFAIVYTIAIVASFSHSPWLRRFGFSVLPLMWLLGMMDAYISPTQRRRWLLTVLPGALVSLIVLGIQIFPIMNGHSMPDVQTTIVPPAQESARAEPASDSDRPDATQTETEPDISEFFSIQVAAFREDSLYQAEGLCDELMRKGYIARIEKPLSVQDGWYRVLIGEFATEQEAKAFAEPLRDREKFSYMIVHRRPR